MRDFLDSILGTYTPVTFQDSYGNVVVGSGVSGVDWSYILTGVLFIVVVYSVFRILGSFFSRM